jgi:hypothetical protein
VTDFLSDAQVTVTVVRRVPAGRNAYGNATYDEVRTDVPGCLVAWGGSTEDTDDADRTTDTATVYDTSALWPTEATNRVEIAGERWEVDGTPQRWPGAIGGTVINLRKVRG